MGNGSIIYSLLDTRKETELLPMREIIQMITSKIVQFKVELLDLSRFDEWIIDSSEPKRDTFNNDTQRSHGS